MSIRTAALKIQCLNNEVTLMFKKKSNGNREKNVYPSMKIKRSSPEPILLGLLVSALNALCWKVHLELRPAGACANRTFDNCAPDDALLNTHTRIHSQSRLRNQPLFSLFAFNWLSSRLAHCNGLFAALIFNEMLGSAHISLPHPHTGSQLIVLWGS